MLEWSLNNGICHTKDLWADRLICGGEEEAEGQWTRLRLSSCVFFILFVKKSLNQITDNKTWSLDMWQVDRKFIYILFYFSSLAASEENWKIGGLETPPLMVND